MEENSQASQLPGSSQSQQRPVSHTRPFFYVQPPSQPCYMYQWQGSHPYNHYAFQGSGLPFGRPYLSPYSYMQYPGYVMPHAPVHLLDYRRLCDPHFNPAAYDAVRRHHHPAAALRETTCTGAQTDPSDALNKLIECLDKLRASDSSPAEREEDSGVTSPGSAIFSPREDGRREDGRREGSEAHQPDAKHMVAHQASSAPLFSSVSMPCGPRAGQGKEEAWSLDSGEAPLDSSSLHEESEGLEQEANDEDDLHVRRSLLDVRRGPEDGMMQGRGETKQGEQQSAAVTTVSRGDDDGGGDLELPHRIVHLPFGKVLSAEEHLKDVATKPPAVLPPLSGGSPLYYGYCAPQLAHERLSVLSPSLDELSSRDEMFSTDLEDIDLFPGHVYAMNLQKPAPTSDGGGCGAGACSRKHTCSKCGLRVSKRALKAGSCNAESYCCDDGPADSDEGVEDDPETRLKSYSSSSRKKPPTCQTACHKHTCLQQTKVKSRRLYCRGELEHQQGVPGHQEMEHSMHKCCEEHSVHKCCEELAALSEMTHRHESMEEQHRRCRDKQWRERGDCLQQVCCEGGCGKGLAKAQKVQPLPQRQVRGLLRRSVAKPSLHQRSELQNPEDNEDCGDERERP